MKRLLYLMCAFLIYSAAYSDTRVVTTLKEDFFGKLYVYEDKDDALSGLRVILSEKIEKRLKGMGFSSDYIINLLKKANYKNLTTVEKRVEILKDGKKVKTTAFDISGDIYIPIDEQDVKALGEDLRRFSPVSDEERVFYRDALRGFLELASQIRDIDTTLFKLKLSEIYKSDIIKQIQNVFGADNTSFQTLKDRVIDVLNYIETNRIYLDVESNIKEVVDDLISNVESYYKRSIVDITNYQNAIDCAESISKMMPYKKEETLKSLFFIVEFKWAENIQNVSQSSNIELGRISNEISGFVDRFGSSKFMKNIKGKVSMRLIDELKGEGLDYDHLKYALIIAERLGLKEKELIGLMIDRCVSIMEGVESSSDEVSVEINKSFESCIKISPPDKKKRLMAFKDKFIKSDKTRIYKNSLGNLAFIMRFVRYADSIPFGGTMDAIGLSKFSDFLNEGSLTSNCSCSQNPTDECRIFSYAGEQFELVISSSNSKVYKVAICNMNISGKESVVFAFLKDSFKPLFKGDSSSLEGRDGSFDYEFKKGIILTLEKVGSYGSLSIYDKSLRPKDDGKVSYTSKETGDSIAFKKGDCVEWDCDVECRYKGKVEKVSGSEVQVIITSAPKAAELNMRKGIIKSGLKRCTTY